MGLDSRIVRETAVRLLEIAAEMEGKKAYSTCTCDHCGDQSIHPRDGLRCLSGTPEAASGIWVRCPGTYRADPEPDHEPDYVRLSDGRTLPVTTTQVAMDLAMEQAAADFHLPLDAPAYVLGDLWGDEG